jgi:ABC-type sugar transport system ATPase subunit
MAFVELRNVVKTFGGVRMIHEISVEIREGEFIVILGPSGCGKSTTLRMIAGLEDLTAGEIHIGGRRVDQLAPKDRGCAMVFQNYALYPHMSVRGNIAYGLKVAGMPARERNARVAEVAALLELDALLDRRPSQLSGGQRQRVAIARAIAREPKVFLFDEPLSNLDAKLRATMRTELRRLHDRIGATSIFVTHDQVEAMTLADRIIVMNKGHIAQIGTPSEIYCAPADIFVAGFVGTPPMNLIPGTITASGTIVCAGAWSLPVPPQASVLPPGSAVTVGIRPEDLLISASGLPGTLSQVEDLGAQRLLYVTAGGQDIVVMETSRTEVRRGAELCISVRDNAYLLFPAISKA